MRATILMTRMKPLRLLEFHEVPDSETREFSVSSQWQTMLLVGAVIGFCIWIGLQGGINLGKSGALPDFIAWWAVFWLDLYWLLVVNHFLKSLKPSAWLNDNQGLHIKWRSYQNVAW